MCVSCTSVPDPVSRRSAFTLVELVLVVVIIAVIAGIATPRYGSAIAHQQIDAAVRRIETDLALVQQRAKFSSTSQTIQFDALNESYGVVGMVDPDHPARIYRVELSVSPYDAAIHTVDFGGTSAVTFDGYGDPDNKGTIVIKVGNTYKTITVGGGGKPTVKEGIVPLVTLPPQVV